VKLQQLHENIDSFQNREYKSDSAELILVREKIKSLKKEYDVLFTKLWVTYNHETIPNADSIARALSTKRDIIKQKMHGLLQRKHYLNSILQHNARNSSLKHYSK
jgi:metal-responsive CopG/Arc/MetJ family transcriptional regulator